MKKSGCCMRYWRLRWPGRLNFAAMLPMFIFASQAGHAENECDCLPVHPDEYVNQSYNPPTAFNPYNYAKVFTNTCMIAPLSTFSISLGTSTLYKEKCENWNAEDCCPGKTLDPPGDVVFPHKICSAKSVPDHWKTTGAMQLASSCPVNPLVTATTLLAAIGAPLDVYPTTPALGDQYSLNWGDGERFYCSDHETTVMTAPPCSVKEYELTRDREYQSAQIVNLDIYRCDYGFWNQDTNQWVKVAEILIACEADVHHAYIIHNFYGCSPRFVTPECPPSGGSTT